LAEVDRGEGVAERVEASPGGVDRLSMSGLRTRRRRLLGSRALPVSLGKATACRIVATVDRTCSPCSASLASTSEKLTVLMAAPASIASITAGAPGSSCSWASSAEASRIDAGASAFGTTPLRLRPLFCADLGSTVGDQLICQLTPGATCANMPRICSAASRRRLTTASSALVAWAMPSWYRPGLKRPQSGSWRNMPHRFQPIPGVLDSPKLLESVPPPVPAGSEKVCWSLERRSWSTRVRLSSQK
jgi:hypothetical protein